VNEMTEPPRSWAGQWMRFLELRSKMQDCVSALEVTHSSLTYGIKTEGQFRDRLRELQRLLDEVNKLLGEPGVNPLVQ
jgi:hypothetical protein